jgi:membrane-bound lytic murein transglycosylase D
MTSLSTTLVKGIALFFSVTLLASCASDHNKSTFLDFSSQETLENTHPELSDEELIDTESKAFLDEELIALSRTGAWNEKPLADSNTFSDKVVYDFPVVLNNKVNMYLNLFQTKQRNQFRHWLARSTIYRPMMEKELKDAGLPQDLIFLAMIESGYNQLACSSAKAVGLWQFMQATGRQYHLRIDKYVDERRDPLKSTKAAVTYLADLYRDFDDWHLAVAAYNGGPGKIRTGLRKHNVDNFWDLAAKEHLHLETKRYVPKLIAALLIAKNPEKYGFTDIMYHQPVHYDTLTVGPGMSLDAVALISNSTTKEIQQLNQELRLGKTPLNQERYAVKIPLESAAIAAKNLSRLHSVATIGYKTHTITKGDTLTNISKRYNINKTTLLKVNDLRSSKLASGRNMRIPYSTVRYQLLPEGSSKALAVSRENLILHHIKSGDTLSKIAKQYSVPSEMLVQWNGLKNIHAIRAGQQLALYIDRGNTTKRKSITSSIAYLTADKKKFSKSMSDAPYEWYNVKNGDSLWTISRKFRTSTADIKKWNNLKSDRIQPGSQLKLKKV